MAFLRNTTGLTVNAATGDIAGTGEVFADATWSVHPTGVSGEALVWIKQLATVRRLYIKIQVRVNGGAITDIPPCTGMFPITGLNNGASNNVEIRCVQFGSGSMAFYESFPSLAAWSIGTNGGWSAVKTVTPVTTGNTAVTPANWAASLSASVAGSRLKLASGTYTALTLSNKVITTTPIIIDWDGVGSRPFINDMSILTVQGLYVRNIRAAHQPLNSAFHYDQGFFINVADKHITFDKCSFEGGTVVSGGAFVGRGACWAFSFDPGNEHWLFRGCQFDRFGTAGFLDACDSMSWSGCTFTRQTADSIAVSNCRGILLEYCEFRDWDLPPNDLNHVDAFQIQDTTPSRQQADHHLRYNKIGGQTCLHDVQALFGHIEGNPALFGKIQRLLAYENHIYVTSLHGVSFDDVERSLAWNNTCIRNRLSPGTASFLYDGIVIDDTFRPQVTLGSGLHTYAWNNVAAASIAANVSNNYAITPVTPNAVNGYNTVLKDSNADGVADAMGGAGLLSNMVAKPGSIIYTSGYGAAYARP